tara:strand:- start:422 stop:799 length:378 start_codon:yes stop_codon:yes gene_type:complete
MLSSNSMIYDSSIKEDLFIKGIVAFNNQDFYGAHEYWEEIWSDYKLSDPDIIQGMIQFSVGYFHFSNSNPKGAVGLLSKSIKKLTPFIESDILKIDIGEIVENSYKCIERINRGYKIERFTINLI